MTLVIYKYALQTIDEQELTMPVGAKVLCVQVQDGEPYLWALVDTRRPHESRTVLTCGTGNPTLLTPNHTHVGTYQLHGGALVYHVFI